MAFVPYSSNPINSRAPPLGSLQRPAGVGLLVAEAMIDADELATQETMDSIGKQCSGRLDCRGNFDWVGCASLLLVRLTRSEIDSSAISHQEFPWF